MPPDLDLIGRTRDLRWSARLFERLLSAEEPERAELVRALEDLDDPRLVEPLLAVVTCGGDAGLRRACAELLLYMSNRPEPSDATLRAWWASGDDVVRGFALKQMWPPQADLLLSVIHTPEHPVREAAVDGGAFGLRPADKVPAMLAALDDSRPEVRVAAAAALVWDEAIEAESALHRAVQDADPKVARRALLTLGYFPTRATVEVVRAAFDHADFGVRSAAETARLEICQQTTLALLPSGPDVALRRWWGDETWSWLGITDEYLVDARRPHTPIAPRPEPIEYAWLASAQAFDERFGSLDAAWRELTGELYRADWSRAPSSERDAMAERLMGSPDALVRAAGARALAEWRDVAYLDALLDDPCRRVGKAATFAMRSLGPIPELAKRFWDEVVGDRRRPDTFLTAMELSPPREARSRAAAVAADPELGPQLRVLAIDALSERNAVDELRSLMPLLAEPPVINWWVHRALSGAALKHGLAFPYVAHWTDVDHLVPQVIAALPLPEGS